MKIVQFAIIILAISGCTSRVKVRKDVTPIPDSIFRVRYMSADYDAIIRDSVHVDNNYKKAFYSTALSETGQPTRARRFVPEIEKFKFNQFYSQLLNKPAVQIVTPSDFSTYSGWALYKYCFYQKDTAFVVTGLLGNLYQIDSTNPLVRIEAMKFNMPLDLSLEKRIETIKQYQHQYPYWLELYEIESMFLTDIDTVEYKRVTEIAHFLLKKKYHSEYQNKILEYTSFMKEHPDSLASYRKKYSRLNDHHFLPRYKWKN